MTAPTLFVKAKKAAARLDMSEREFLGYVEKGIFPPPCKFDRWDMEQLAAIMRGEPQARHDDIEM